MTHARIVVRGATMALTRRTNMRKAFLGDWDPRVGEIFLYAIADAQRHTKVAVHDAMRCITHQHIGSTPREPNLPEFLRRTNGDISCALNTLLVHCRYHKPGQLFDGRQAHAMRLLDPHAQMSQALYHHLNPVAAGLVSDPRHMPGRHCDFRDWKRGTITVKRPDVYFSKKRPSELQLRVTPPPLLLRAFGGDLDALVYYLERLAKDMTRALVRAQTRAPMGAQRLRRLHPWNEPRTMAEPGGQRVPTFKCAPAASGTHARSARSIRMRAAREVTGFRAQYRESRTQYCQGDRTAVFPSGTYLMHQRFGAIVAAPDAEALVTQPGPTLEDVLDELRDNGNPNANLKPHGRTHRTHELVQGMRETWDDQLGQFADAHAVTFDTVGVKSVDPVTTDSAVMTLTGTSTEVAADNPLKHGPLAHTGEDDTQARPEADPDTEDKSLVEVRRHRDNHAHPEQAARIITLRDHRTGRPRKPRRKPPPR